jgi:hypothetical protein
MEETDHKVRLEKEVASKAVDLLHQPVKDPLGITKQEVISHLQQINLISTNGIN